MNVLSLCSVFALRFPTLCVAALFLSIAVQAAPMQFEVPLGGNAYRTAGEGRARDRVDRDGIRDWQNPDTVFSIYFRVNQAAKLDLSLRLSVDEGTSEIEVGAGGQTFRKKIEGEGIQELTIGNIEMKSAGYVKVDLKGMSKTGRTFAEVKDLLVSSDSEGLEPAYVKEPGGNRFYWGRRGPSVHLGYQLPTKNPIEYFYSEVTVPEGADPIGSYFMANGFGEGYFGMQVNGPEERRILFSVWSPFSTDNPADIPEEDRIVMLKKGKDVRVGEFGNEGSGGQSFLIYPWKAGTNYRFLNTARPDGKGSTIYTAWFFAPEVGDWQLIASFKRPKTDKHLTGMHSFLENFADRNGYLGRMSSNGNQWVRDTEGKWHEVTEARFTGDDIARRMYRMDYAGGSKDGRFFMRNGGFFDEHVKVDTRFKRPPNPQAEPKIDFKSLD